MATVTARESRDLHPSFHRNPVAAPLTPTLSAEVSGLDLDCSCQANTFLFRAVGDYWPHKRVLERVTIAGDVVTR